jgi:hypothetical protein|eukprot:465479-Prymnesium_polylepis.1
MRIGNRQENTFSRPDPSAEPRTFPRLVNVLAVTDVLLPHAAKKPKSVDMPAAGAAHGATAGES